MDLINTALEFDKQKLRLATRDDPVKASIKLKS